jgi:small subunit ribosomal protein S4
VVACVRPSDYAARLREKQKAKRFYGMRERQFRSVCARAGGAVELLRSLELRLDNVLYRLGFAATRAQARQFLVHGHVQVNSRKVDRPSCRVRPGDLVTFKPRSRIEPLVREATERRPHSRWVLAEHDELWGRVERQPERHELDAPVDERLIVEFYSK